MSLKHAFNSLIVDDGTPPGAVGPDEWNAEHVITTLQIPTTGANVVTIAGGAAGDDPVTFTVTGTGSNVGLTFAPKLGGPIRFGSAIENAITFNPGQAGTAQCTLYPADVPDNNVTFNIGSGGALVGATSALGTINFLDVISGEGILKGGGGTIDAVWSCTPIVVGPVKSKIPIHGDIRFTDINDVDPDNGGIWSCEGADPTAVLRFNWNANDVKQIVLGDSSFGKIDFDLYDGELVLPSAPFSFGTVAKPWGAAFFAGPANIADLNASEVVVTDGSKNLVSGGALGSAAFTSSAAYEVPLTFSTGLSRIGNTITATGGGSPFSDVAALVKNDADATKLAIFSAAGITTGTTRTYTLQNRNGTLADLGANVFTALQTITQASANAGILASTGYSLTGSNATNMLDFAGTWNTSGNPIMLKIAATNTASGATTKFAQFLAGASGTTEVFAVDKAGTVAVAALPLIVWSGDGNRGLHAGNGAVYLKDTGGVVFASPSSAGTGWQVASGAGIGWSSTTSAKDAVDTVMTRGAAATIQQGDANAASPVAQTLRAQGSRSGTDTNVGGANYTVSAGLGTGTGALSSLNLASPIAVASGTGAQTMTTGLAIKAGAAVLTNYTVANLPAAATAGQGATAFVTDASTTLILGLGGTVAGGGANKVPVYSDGTSWLYG